MRETNEQSERTHSIDRRAALGAIGAAGFGAMTAAAGAQTGREERRPGNQRERERRRQPDAMSASDLGWSDEEGEYVLPDLPYDYDALEPHIDAQTMRIHHDMHHQGYVNGLNKAMKMLDDIRRGRGDGGLMKHWSRELSFHGGGHVNHTFFWLGMAPPAQGGGGQPTGRLARAIESDFGSFERFKAHFAAAAGAVEGSGWGWLVYDPISGKLLVQQMEKQQNMLLTGCVPLIGVDVWEHAYYLKYQNRRSEYIEAFFNVVNWDRANRLYEAAIV